MEKEVSDGIKAFLKGHDLRKYKKNYMFQAPESRYEMVRLFRESYKKNNGSLDKSTIKRVLGWAFFNDRRFLWVFLKNLDKESESSIKKITEEGLKLAKEGKIKVVYGGQTDYGYDFLMVKSFFGFLQPLNDLNIPNSYFAKDSNISTALMILDMNSFNFYNKNKMQIVSNGLKLYLTNEETKTQVYIPNVNAVVVGDVNTYDAHDPMGSHSLFSFKKVVIYKTNGSEFKTGMYHLLLFVDLNKNGSTIRDTVIGRFIVSPFQLTANTLRSSNIYQPDTNVDINVCSARSGTLSAKLFNSKTESFISDLTLDYNSNLFLNYSQVSNQI